jgi:hypothetical protein
MIMQTKAWMTNFFSKEIWFFIQEVNIRWNFLDQYKHLLVLDGDGYHITLKAIKQAQ